MTPQEVNGTYYINCTVVVRNWREQGGNPDLISKQNGCTPLIEQESTEHKNNVF